MEIPKSSMVVLGFLCILSLCEAIESPQYTVVHSESEFDIRFYRESRWMAAPVRDISFAKATRNGYHRLAMTVPVLTSIIPGAGPLANSVKFYLPVNFQANPPLPLPELNLKPYKWDSHYVAIRNFSGFARDRNIVEEAETLATSLSRSPWANCTSSKGSYAYSIAQYSSPFKFIGCLNEVWVDIDASGIKGCKFSSIATY
ncbi:hypothetical protein UlMin_007937 [Ulmus minor]